MKLPSLYQLKVFVLTYVAYATFHMVRRVLPVIKSELNHQNCDMSVPGGTIITNDNLTTWCDWQPFDGEHGNSWLGFADFLYLISYAVGMLGFAGLAERADKQRVLSISMYLTGFTSSAFAYLYLLRAHDVYSFLSIQVLSGLVQSQAYPVLSAIFRKNFDGQSKGLAWAIWNTCVSAGNLAGSFFVGALLRYGWGWPALVLGVIIIVLGCVINLSTLSEPEDDGHREAPQASTSGSIDSDPVEPPRTDGEEVHQGGDEVPLVINQHRQAIGYLGAFSVPGIWAFSLASFFAKPVNHTLIYWLPKYIDSCSDIGSTYAAFISGLLDFGGVLGVIFAGYIADQTQGKTGHIILSALAFVIPITLVYSGACQSIWLTMALLLLLGMLLTGASFLINATIPMLREQTPGEDSTTTTTSIIDSAGSFGAAFGPLLVGLIANQGWDYMFYGLIFADILAIICIFPVRSM